MEYQPKNAIKVDLSEKKCVNTRIKIIVLLIIMIGVVACGAYFVDKTLHPKVILGGQTIYVDYIEEGILFIKDGYKADFSRVIDSDTSIVQISEMSIISKNDLKTALNRYGNKMIEVKILRNGKIFSELMMLDKGVFAVEKAETNTGSSGKISMYIPEISYALSFAHPLVIGDINGVVYKAKAIGLDSSCESIDAEKTDEIIGIMMGNDVYGATIKYNKQNLKVEEPVYIEIARKKEVELGKAYLYTDFGEGLDYYEIEIVSLKDDSDDLEYHFEVYGHRGYVAGEDKIDKERFLFKLVDKRLTQYMVNTIKGMSGSPIVQNGKIIGFNGYYMDGCSIAIYAETAYWDTIVKFLKGELKWINQN